MSTCEKQEYRVTHFVRVVPGENRHEGHVCYGDRRAHHPRLEVQAAEPVLTVRFRVHEEQPETEL